MGEVQSRYKKMKKDGVGGRRSVGELMQQISADIAAGNDGDILDMQCTMHMDESMPHLSRQSHTMQSTQESLDLESTWTLPEPPLRQARSLEYESLSLEQLEKSDSTSDKMMILETKDFSEEPTITG